MRRGVRMRTGKPRNFGDLEEDGVERLLVACERCGLTGDYSVASLVLQFGSDEQLPGLPGQSFGSCPIRKTAYRDRRAALSNNANCARRGAPHAINARKGCHIAARSYSR